MARPPRIQFQGAFYHIIVRGNQQQTIFNDNNDRIKYLELIERYKKQHGFILYAYTLMTNHVHLLIETPKSPISRIMQVINFTYTRYFNHKYKKVGHLFQGRYKAYLCDRDKYLLSLVRYIHLNPVRAKLVKNPHQYKWGSHRAYLDGIRGHVETDKVLRMFSERPSQARILYRDFVNEGMGVGRDESIYNAVGQQILGDDRFIEKVEQAVDNIDKHLKRPSLRKIFLAVAEVTGIAYEEITSRSRGEDAKLARNILVRVCRETGYRLVDLQSEFKRDLSVLSRWCRASENMEGWKIVQQVIGRLNA
ncbi:MAG: transposase [Nitrospirota bacterium]